MAKAPRLEKLRWLLRVLSIATTVLAVYLLATEAPNPAWYSQLMALSAVGLWFAHVGVSRSYLTQRVRDAQESTSAPSTIVESRIDEWQDRLDYETASLLLGMLTRPKDVTRRISEDVKFDRHAMRITTTRTLDISPEATQEYVIIPACEQWRGLLIDGLKIRGPSDNRLSSLTQTDTRHILMVLARLLIDDLEPKSALRRLKPASVEAARVAISEKFATLVCRNTREGAIDDWKHLADKNGLILSQFRDNQAATILRRLALEIAEKYPVLVVVPLNGGEDTEGQFEPSGLRIEVESIEPVIRSREHDGPLSRLIGLLQSVLYVVPPRSNFPLDNADRAQSYHLNVAAPDGLYFFEMRVVDRYRAGGKALRAGAIAKQNISSAQLQSSAHYYASASKNHLGKALEVSFKERLPGSVSSALLWSSVTSLLAITVFISSGATSNGLFAVLLPALFAGLATGSVWQGLSEVRSPYGGRMASRIGSLVNLTLCVWAVIQASLDSTSPNPIEGGQEASWLLLLSLSSANTLYLASLWLVDSLVEQWFLAGHADQ